MGVKNLSVRNRSWVSEGAKRWNSWVQEKRRQHEPKKEQHLGAERMGDSKPFSVSARRASQSWSGEPR
jgi:hypothetical protein